MQPVHNIYVTTKLNNLSTYKPTNQRTIAQNPYSFFFIQVRFSNPPFFEYMGHGVIIEKAGFFRLPPISYGILWLKISPLSLSIVFFILAVRVKFQIYIYFTLISSRALVVKNYENLSYFSVFAVTIEMWSMKKHAK